MLRTIASARARWRSLLTMSRARAPQEIGAVTLLVREYDEAIRFYDLR
ncbi:hypothetical protein SAMN05444161_3543 [Rhizobiales bacterium GAS191]|nr:hypothetical protein SAMN05444161_3543 [Rhizobiales bacterium GAS191]